MILIINNLALRQDHSLIKMRDYWFKCGTVNSLVYIFRSIASGFERAKIHML